MFDIIAIGGGPAGLSAAITARQRGKSVAIVSNDYKNSGLYRAPAIDNYPGLPGISGRELLDKLMDHALGAGAEYISGRVNTVLNIDGVFNVGYNTDILSSKSIIIATGIAQTSLFPGEEELLGKGVSYCATCDGMLYRGKRVCVICLAPEEEAEAEYLSSIGCEVIRLASRNIAINGDKQVESVTADSETISCDGVFILRRAVAPHLLVMGLQMEDGHIFAGQSGSTNVPGVFAAGDCTGKPYQIARAAGQGLTAALSASEYISSR